MGSEAQAADVVGFAAFYRAHYVAIVAFFQRRVDDRELARDLTAETFRIAWMRWDSGVVVTRAWLYGVAYNLVGDEWRRRARLGPVGELPDTLEAPDRQRDIEVRLLLASMDATQRRVLLLTYWDGLSAGEVATALGISRASVWTRLHRARRAFADAWDAPPTARPSRPTQPRHQPFEESS
ncbi:RNA polymerase sigma factor [Amnibacterium endophyticum]|uniref:RNA polymerase sigma factor n=1 Tax=Amnibacterium endophyticum TaxID=2109337 RepID=A0ABW4LJT8_9MICO